MGITQWVQAEVPEVRCLVTCAECGMTSEDLSLWLCPQDGAVLGEVTAP
jgi:hypothetical protein